MDGAEAAAEEGAAALTGVVCIALTTSAAVNSFCLDLFELVFVIVEE